MSYDRISEDRVMSRAEQAYLTEPEGDDHYEACPCHEDQPQICRCGVQADGHALIPVPDCDGLEVVEPECGCREMERNEAAERADAKNDADRDRMEDPR